MSYAEFKAASTFFRDLEEDLQRYTKCFAANRLLLEHPVVYASAALMELDSLLLPLYNPLQPEETHAAFLQVFSEWFPAHFTPERLDVLKKDKVIAQQYGFIVSFAISFDVSTKHQLGLLTEDD